jgi:hypothetical protein
MTGLTADWKKSARSNGDQNCVEARERGGWVQIRDSKDATGPVLSFAPETYRRFLGAVKLADAEFTR